MRGPRVRLPAPASTFLPRVAAPSALHPPPRHARRIRRRTRGNVQSEGSGPRSALAARAGVPEQPLSSYRPSEMPARVFAAEDGANRIGIGLLAVAQRVHLIAVGRHDWRD